MQKIINIYLNANDKTEDDCILTAVLLSKDLSLKEKELLLLFYHLSSSSPELMLGREGKVIITLGDIQRLGLALKQASSVVLKNLINKEIIEWDKSQHLIVIRKDWVLNQINKIRYTELETFYKLILKQL